MDRQHTPSHAGHGVEPDEPATLEVMVSIHNAAHRSLLGRAVRVVVRPAVGLLACTGAFTGAFAGAFAGMADDLRAQEPATAEAREAHDGREDVAKFAADLRRAHFADGTPRTFHSFQMGFKLTGKANGDVGSVTIVAKTTYFRWEKEPGEFKPLIRTSIYEGEEPVERGYDQYTGWIRKDGSTKALLGNAAAAELEGIQRDINLSQQLLRYLDPAAVIDRLQDVSAVTEESIAAGRGRTIECRTVRGRLEAFPFYYRGGEASPAQIQVWIDDASGQLVAVEATPVFGDQLAPALREKYRVSGLEAVDGVLIPRTLVLYRPGPDGQPVWDAKVEISSMELNPQLTVADLARPTAPAKK